jgi:hypothetical protein
MVLALLVRLAICLEIFLHLALPLSTVLAHFALLMALTGIFAQAFSLLAVVTQAFIIVDADISRKFVSNLQVRISNTPIELVVAE